MRSRSGFTFLELIVALSIILLLAGLMLPVFARGREAARRSSCQSNLKQIVTALHLYAQDHNGRLPSRERAAWWVAVLMPHTKNYAIYRCPSEPAEARRKFGDDGRSTFSADWDAAASPAELPAQVRPGHVSYQYQPGLANDDAGSSPVARDWRAWHFDGANVAFLDGRVQWMREADTPLPAAPRPDN